MGFDVAAAVVEFVVAKLQSGSGAAGSIRVALAGDSVVSEWSKEMRWSGERSLMGLITPPASLGNPVIPC